MTAPKSYTVVQSIKASSQTTTVIEKAPWLQLTYKLEATAGGKSYLVVGAGSTGMLVEPGDTGTLLVAPGTLVRVKTTATANVLWSFTVTPLKIVDELAATLQDMRTLLQMLACAEFEPGDVNRALSAMADARRTPAQRAKDGGRTRRNS